MCILIAISAVEHGIRSLLQMLAEGPAGYIGIYRDYLGVIQGCRAYLGVA